MAGYEGSKSEGQNEPKPFIVKLQDSNALLYLFGLAFIAYLVTRNVLFAVLSGFSLVSIFALDIAAGASRHGIRAEAFELVKAIIVALVIWFGINILLGTSSPISGIVSCSLLPAYERGDMIVLRGISVSEINAPSVDLTAAEFAAIYRKPHPPCGTIGPINYVCTQSCPRISSVSKQPVTPSVKCVREIVIHNVTFHENLTNDVIVYAPSVLGVHQSGDIIHRVVMKMNVGDKTYILTKGDNNDFFDAAVFDIIPEEDVKGRVIMRIPILGYLKLFISGYFADPVGCDTILQH